MIGDADVIVVGAGPAGSAAAAELARRGVRVMLLDRARFPRDKPCGDYCNPGAARALAELGCEETVMAAGAARIDGMTVYTADGARFAASFPGGSGLLIPRRRLDAALVRHAVRSGAEFVEGAAVDRVRMRHDAIEVHAAGRAVPLRARLVIAADGVRSTVARRLGLFVPVTTGRYTVGAYFSNVARNKPRGELHLGPDFYCGVAHFGGGAANVCMALPRHRWQRRTPEAAFAAALRLLPALRDALAGARREEPFRCSGPLGFAPRRPVANRVLLVGDAAGPIDPMTGQGIFFALTSGRLAAQIADRALAAGDLSARGLGGYARARGRMTARTVIVARALQRLAFRPRLTPFLVRRLGAAPELAARLLGVTGNVLPPGAILSPSYILRLLAGQDAHPA